MEIVFHVEVRCPQLDGVMPFLHTLGGQLMADMSQLNASLVALRTAIETEAAQVVAKLEELAAVLAADQMDQQHVDAARALVDEMIPMVGGMVPDAPPAP
jgi:hypothetical protein